MILQRYTEEEPGTEEEVADADYSQFHILSSSNSCREGCHMDVR